MNQIQHIRAIRFLTGEFTRHDDFRRPEHVNQSKDQDGLLAMIQDLKIQALLCLVV